MSISAAASSAWLATLADPSRLTLLLCIHQAGPISVTDLAVAADMNDTTVSQALRLLRASGTVAAKRDGRVVRYELADELTAGLLDRVLGDPAAVQAHVSHAQQAHASHAPRDRASR